MKPAPVVDFDPLFPGCCSLAHGEGVPRAVTGPDVDVTGADLPFCAPHMALLPKALRKKLEDVAGVSIFDADRHQEVRELLARASKAVDAHRGPVPGICRVCGCIDEAACEGGCSWVDKQHTLCSACVTVEDVKAKDVATIELKNYKREPGWYWTFDGHGEPGGRCGPYKTQGAAARSARSNGFKTVTKRPKGRK